MDKSTIGSYFGLAMILIVPMGIYAFVLIDKLIKRLYEVFNDEWCHLGKPSGLFYFPPNSRNFQSMISLQINMFIWVFKTPKWIKDDAISLSMLKKIRWVILVANIGIIVLFGFIFMSIVGSIK